MESIFLLNTIQFIRCTLKFHNTWMSVCMCEIFAVIYDTRFKFSKKWRMKNECENKMKVDARAWLFITSNVFALNSNRIFIEFISNGAIKNASNPKWTSFVCQSRKRPLLICINLFLFVSTQLFVQVTRAWTHWTHWKHTLGVRSRRSIWEILTEVNDRFYYWMSSYYS